jgi:UDP:flavonoid glycosyltransferase YjiC (YdhE family)
MPATTDTPSMRILLAGEGTRGDLQPLIELADRLRAAGHEALVAGPPDFTELAAARGVAYAPQGPSFQAFISEHAAMLQRNPIAVMREAIAFLRERLEDEIDSLVALARDADLVVGGGAQMAAPTAARCHGVPYRYVCYCPALLPSVEHPPILVSWDNERRWLNRLLWPLMLGPISLLLRPLFAPIHRRLGLPPVRSPYRHMLGTRPLLAADAILSGPPGDSPIAVDQVPALQPRGGEPLPPKLDAFLASGPAPVFVGFGSMPDPDPLATTRRVLAAVEQLGVRAIVSAGWAQLGGVPLPEGVIEIGPVAHTSLFPRCAAIVHHGGAGTTTTALRAGVPQVVVPHLADQYYWGRRLRAVGIGLVAARKHRLRTEDLVRTLGVVLENEIVRERAAELGARARSDAAALDPIGALLSRS